MSDPSGPWDGSSEIADALNALWDIVASRHPRRGDPEGLQRLIDQLLDVRPAATVAELEHRLLALAGALDDLGPWVADREIVAEAERRSWRLH